jgi:hypothetical protein
MAAQNFELGDEIRFRVITASNNGNSDPFISAPTLLAFAPSAPREVQNDPDVTTNERIGLKWTEPVTDNGSPIREYEVFNRQADGTEVYLAVS